MKIDPQTALVSVHGLKLSTGTRLEDLRALRASDFRYPLISNDQFETYRIVDSEAATHIVFKNGKLWQVRISLLIPEAVNSGPSAKTERLRHVMHEAELQRLIGANSLRCSNGTTLELCFDERSMSSSIVITFPVPELRVENPK